RRRVCLVRIGRADLVLGNHVRVGRRVEDEEPAIRRVLWMKRQAERALLAAARNVVRDAEERDESVLADDLDPACLLDCEPLVAPAYNEERNLAAFISAIVPVLESIGETFEIVFVNDGSRDGTLGMLAAAASQDPRIKVVGLARNFGKDIALSAGLAHASGQA